MHPRRATLCLAIAFSLAATAAAEDVFYHVSAQQLKLTEGELPQEPAQFDFATWRRGPAMQPYVALDGPGEAYADFGELPWSPWSDPRSWSTAGFVAVRAEKGQKVTGRLFVPASDFSSMTAVKFSIAPSVARKEHRAAFLRARSGYYSNLFSRGLPGGAWFRHQARVAQRALDQNDAPADNQPRETLFNSAGEFDGTYALFSGGRAVSENLQLDRALAPVGPNDEAVELSALDGITIGEIDWKPFIKDLSPETDPLAARIPADQHAVFFPSFAALMAMGDEVERQGTPVFRLLDPRAEDDRVKARYERQLGLSLSAVARLLGPAVVQSVAITGSDPYFFAGTDVAVLLETKGAEALRTLLTAKIGLAAKAEKNAKQLQGKLGDTDYVGFRSPDRRMSSYVAILGEAVVVTNSLAQLERLVDASTGKTPALSSLAEYTFFRGRYPRGAADESALVILSDATIRRWCSPRWRIADSRRTRDSAVLGQLQAEFLERLVAGKIESGPIHTDHPVADGGELRLTAAGVRSSTLGDLEFLTPIVEMPLTSVSQAEADAYTRWRDGYQQNWRWSFDPIALRLGARDDQLSADLTVMPLIWGTDYRELVNITRGAEIKPNSGDPHETLGHWVVALNVKSATVQQAGNFAASMLRINPLDWLGSSVALFADNDEFWQEMASVEESDRNQWVSTNFTRLPLGLYCEVASPLKLTAFLTGIRGVIEQTAPGMTAWESLTYRDEPYVKVSPSERAKGDLPPGITDPALYYAFSGNGLLVTLNEPLLKRYLDRQVDRREAKKEGKQIPAAARPWLGSSLCAQFDARFVNYLGAASSGEYRAMMQLRAWGNLPILNEWRRRWPDKDPVELHEQFWQTRLVCPGGGKYVWNEAWQTMESTEYGHPGQPKPGPAMPAVLQSLTDVNLGLTFEEQGLRAKAAVGRTPPK